TNALVEFLGVGQQFVAYGIHPNTGRPYDWVSADEPRAYALAKLPAVTPDQLRECLRQIAARCTELGYPEVTISNPSDPALLKARAMKRRQDRDSVPMGELREILGYIPPDSSRNEWIGIIAAIQATNLRDVSEDEMDTVLLDVADEWSR